MRLYLLFTAIAFLLLAACTMQVNPNQQIPQISSSGEGEITTSPDQATAYVQIVTQGKIASEAQTYNKALANKVKDTFLNNGLKEEDIETSSYNVNPERVYIPPKDPNTVETYQIRGYTVTHAFKVTVKDLDKLGEMVDDAVKAGANSVDNVVFGLSKQKEIQVKGEALKIASKKAKEKAEAIADSLGIRLGKVLSASESGGYTPYYSDYRFAANKAMDVAAEAAPSPITPGKVDVQTSVNLVYEINQ
ncbi:MAG TPA: SIMPL domain-containing protein [Candidatus Nanoarchaeia archaeon]|nr:SIMPL domain-containing protein [Candidatus Nanoarchaeia archaeon]